MILKINQKEQSKRKCTLSEEMQKLMINQLQHEMYNHNLYLTFANFYATQGLIILEKYYKERAEEEKKHHDWIYNYLNICDVSFSYPEIKAISETFNDNIEPFKLTVDKEIETTSLIYKMVDLSLTEKDWATYNWLLGHDDKVGKLVDEQIEEESISRTALDIASQDGSWLRKEKSIMNAYTGDLD